MAFLVFLVVLNVLMFQAGAAQEEDIPSFDGEVQRREETRRSSDIASLLNKLISDMEGIKGQILSEVPEQLEKQSEEIKKIAEDLKSFKEIVNGLQELIIAQDHKSTASIAKLSKDFEEQTKKLDDIKGCCAKQEDATKNSQQHLTKIETSLAKATGQISQNLRFHDQRLQNLSTQGFCNKSASPIYKDCSEIRWKVSRSSGAYRISLNNRLIEVYCDFDTPGGDWLVFQRRKDGAVDFYRNWASYANGFGNVNWEFWLGNEILHQLTSNRRYKLRVDLEDFENQKRFAEYSSFSLGPSSDYYRLKIGNYSGDAGDSFSGHNDNQFSTHDVDRDTWAYGSCAHQFRGAWWYTACHASNLNGKFYRGNHSTYADGVNWYHWRAHYYSLKSEMKISLLY